MKQPLTWAHKVSAAFLLAMTGLYVWLIYSAATVDWPEYPTPVVQAPIIQTVMSTVVVTATPTDEPTRAPTATRAPYLSPTPSRTPTPIWIADPANGRMNER